MILSNVYIYVKNRGLELMEMFGVIVIIIIKVIFYYDFFYEFFLKFVMVLLVVF